MTFKPEITVGGEKYDLVDVQRGEITAIYKNEAKYLRIGDPGKIARDLAFHKEMASFGFPVPRLLGEGVYADMQFFLEESLGDEHFGQIFKQETEKTGRISDTSFEEYLTSYKKFATAQLNTKIENKDWTAFEHGIHLAIILGEMPELREKILQKYESIKSRISALPFVRCHGDFTPFNTYPEGVIDFEAAFTGPAGYDLGGLIELWNWFPTSRDYEFYQLYNFTSAQRQELLDATDLLYTGHGLPKPSNYLPEFNFLKGIWFVVRMHHTPKLQQFRYNQFKKLLN